MIGSHHGKGGGSLVVVGGNINSGQKKQQNTHKMWSLGGYDFSSGITDLVTLIISRPFSK